jgi:Prolyl oligopeptidase family
MCWPPSWPDFRSTGAPIDVKKDLVCANQYAASVAGDYGADPDQSWTLVGHSLGASIVLIPRDDVLDEPGGTLDPCIDGLPDFGAIVAVEGCYYDSPDDPIGDVTMPESGTPVTLVAGEKDETCPAWQSANAARALEEAGYDVTLVTIPGGTHGTPLFLDPSQDPWAQLRSDDPGDPVGDRVRAVLTLGATSPLGRMRVHPRPGAHRELTAEVPGRAPERPRGSAWIEPGPGGMAAMLGRTDLPTLRRKVRPAPSGTLQPVGPTAPAGASRWRISRAVASGSTSWS